MIPLCDLTLQYRNLKQEIDAAMQAVAEQGHYVLGPNVKAFEAEMAAYCGCRYAIGVGNGTDALHLALRALGIGPGDEVITTPFTFVATTEAIGMVGARPVFIDIEPRTFNIDPNRIEAAITPRTRALLPVHLYGQPCDMDAIMDIAQRRGLLVVEDCAQSLGATWRGRKTGTFGAAGCLSFFPSKNLGCFGDGGMVVTNDPQVYERVEMLRRHGGKVKYHHEELGLNSRLDELQAAILRVKLPHLDQWNRQRREHALVYNRLLKDVAPVIRPAELGASGGIAIPEAAMESAEPAVQAIYHQYTLQVAERELVMRRLQELQVGHAVYYPVPLHLQKVHSGINRGPGSFPLAENAARRCLSLPMFPELSAEQQQRTVSAVMESVGFEARRRAG